MLAGGIGSRLSGIAGNLPKCMMEIAGRPFIFHLIEKLLNLGAEKIVLATANKSQIVESYVRKEFDSEIGLNKVLFSVEDKPTGTAGAVSRALKYLKSETFLVTNADTIIPNLDKSIWRPLEPQNNFLLFLTEMDGERFSYFEASNGVITKTLEDTVSTGKTSSGMVLVRRSFMAGRKLSKGCSLENDLIIDQIHQRKVGFDTVDQFLDFGVPEDLKKAQVKYSTTIGNVFDC